MKYAATANELAMLKLIVDFGTLLIGGEGAKTPAGGRGRGDPAGAQRRGGSPDRPRTARAWSGNQQASLTELMN
ncbi:hypothetical protein KW850_10900 [Bacillus sp. sid0103]|uniref:hypothetical protein n=1 Tax=Bacillus sp. sid0103 TaxID=2856337 RepID=UPI001C4575E4|nr:hypothetical protein [Bacillus sp. sid0103]MBV7505762.1 hypothetical protein [Bacillus sp. sid0103]